jgi:hypothetical protein
MGMKNRWTPTASMPEGLPQRGVHSIDTLRRFLGSYIQLRSTFLFDDLSAENFADLDRRCPRLRRENCLVLLFHISFVKSTVSAVECDP